MESDNIEQSIEKSIEQPIEQSIEQDDENVIKPISDNIIITNASSDNENVENLQSSPKTKTKSRKQFKEDCNHCSKTFKSKLTYDKHISQQLCYTQDEISYCKICSITLTSHNEYKKHLFTMEHLNNIGYSKIERLQTKEVSQVHLADPYLNSNDVNKIATTNLGDSFTFVFNVGNTKTISLINNIEKQNTVNNLVETTSLSNIESSKEELNTSSNTSSNTSLEPTARQQKLISILEKQINDNITPNDSGKIFYKMLDNKLQIEDYKGLQKIISNLNFPDNYKDTYLKVTELFISMLVKEKTKGEKLYKDKDISQLVINLTS